MSKAYKLKHGTYRVEYTQIDGLCEQPFWAYKDNPTPKYYTITVDPRLRGQRKLETIIHEALHAACPKMSEADVTRIAHEQAVIVWGEGYRESKP